MFLRRSEPVLLTEERLEGLCPSLNRPVVDVEQLPVGPARSAIALYRDGEGRRSLVVSVRSEESGAVVLFEFQGELNANSHQALDVGLTFAEGMGFLFDDDILASVDPARHRLAVETWCALTGDEPPAPSGDVAPEPPAPVPALELSDLADPADPVPTSPPPGPALELADLVDGELDLGDDPNPVQPPVLSKFRRADAEVADTPTPDPSISGAQLARIPIVRRRRQPSDGPAPVPLLTRLLARF